MPDDKVALLMERIEKDQIPDDSRITTIISGGMDSVTLLHFALRHAKPQNIQALSFDYGQKHKKELEMAKAICNELGVSHSIVELPSLTKLLDSSLTSEKDVPHGHYAEENMKATVVPNRNAIMLSMAYGAAISFKSHYLLYGAHTGDHFIYPDCRPEFVEALDRAFQIGNAGFGAVKLVAPFSSISKSDIATIGIKALEVTFEKTWSCYEGQERPCLQCGTCIERIEAFLDNDTPDPLLTPEEWETAKANHAKAVEEYQQSQKK